MWKETGVRAAGKPPQVRFRLYGQNTGDRGWVVQEVEPVACSYLDHRATEASEQCFPA